MGTELPSTNQPIEEGELSKEDIIDALGDESEDETPAKEGEEEEPAPKSDEGEEEEEPKETKEEIKLKIDDTEELDEELKPQQQALTPAKRQEILKKYPNFFKEFPEMERSYYRDRGFSEHFATPEEAKEAAERVQILNTFESQLVGGDIRGVLHEIKQNNPRALAKIADNYMAALGEVDKNAQVHVTSGIIKGLIVSLVNEARVQDNDELKRIALGINQFCFGSSEFKAHTALGGPDENPQVSDERMQFLAERYETTVGDLDRRVSNTLKATISEYIDPKKLMTDWAKGNAVKEALDATFASIKNDDTFRKQLDRLWKAAADNKFDHRSVNAIRAAYLNKAKTFLSGHIKNARNNALRGIGKRVREEKPEEDRITRPRQSSSSTNRGQSGKTDKYKGMSTLDALNSD